MISFIMMHSRTLPKLTINLENLAHNYKTLQLYAKDSFVGAVIKANAYGLGASQVFECLFNSGCRHFFISDWQEVMAIPRRDNCKIYALAGVEPKDQEIAANYGVVPVLHRKDQILNWISIYGKSKKCSVQIETGLNRLGIDASDLESFKSQLDIEFIVSHMACGYEVSHQTNRSQLEICSSTATDLSKSTVCSCGFILPDEDVLKDSHIIRVGRYLYGIKYGMEDDHYLFSEIKTVASLQACLISYRHIKKGDLVGYDHCFKANNDMVIGILNIGYNGGYTASNKVYYKDNFYPVICQSMDFTTIDITNINDFTLGETYFELFGENLIQQNSFSRQITIISGGNVVREYLNK